METLPYSITEIYEIHESRKYGVLKQKSNVFVRRYNDHLPRFKPSAIITEDSNSGFQFFNKSLQIPCSSANGKSNIKNIVRRCPTDNTLIIVDGAAFGSNIESLSLVLEALLAMGIHMYVFAPESFEWLILRSQLFYKQCSHILKEAYNYIDARQYTSWEQYFTDLLIELTLGKPSKYSKKNLNNYYLNSSAISSILNVVDCIESGESDRSDDSLREMKVF